MSGNDLAILGSIVISDELALLNLQPAGLVVFEREEELVEELVFEDD